jgi:hypothetical protein
VVVDSLSNSHDVVVLEWMSETGDFMKIQNLSKSLAVIAVAGLMVLAVDAKAQTAAAPPQLSYGVPEIAQLAQAKVGDSTIIAYIKNSGISYGLDANQIVYLRQQGVSDAVITTMLSQPKPVVAAAPATVPVPTTPAPQVASPATVATVPAPTTTVVTAPTVTYVQPVPTTYYYAQPYYAPSYYSSWVPNISLGFAFGGGRYYGGRGCYYGGWHGGGGWHH